MRRPLPLGIAVGLVALCSLLIGFAAVASAAPTVGFVVPGSADQSLGPIERGNDGSVWVQQATSGGQQLKRYSATGDLLGTSDDFAGDAGPIASAPDGSAWLVADGKVQRVEPDGNTAGFSLPDGWMLESLKLAVDSNSNAWAVACEWSHDDGEFVCSVLRFTADGAVAQVSLPHFNHGVDVLVGVTTTVDIFAVPGGVWIHRTRWMSPMWSFSEFDTAFVSDSGAVTPIDLGANRRLVSPAPDGKAWWMEWSPPSDSGDAPSITFGQATQDANVLLASEPITGDFNNTAPVLASNSAGHLLFAGNHTDTLGWVGGFTGSEAYVRGTAALATVLAPREACPESFGTKTACEFGDSIFQTLDGAIWTLASPHVPQVGRLAADGTWTRFSPLTGYADDLTVSGMTQSSDGAIWFAFEKADGTHMISRADPTDPPADETPVPVDPTGPTGDSGSGGSTGGTVTGKSGPIPAASQAELQAIAVIARKAARKWRGGHFSSKINLPFPRAGRLDITIRSGSTVLAKVAKTRGAGSHKIKLKVGTAGRKLLKHHRKVKVTLTAKFSTSGRAQATSALDFTL